MKNAKTRKARKQERKLKKFTASLSEKTRAILKDIGRAMTRALSPYIGGKHYCPVCRMWYCNGFDGVIVFCRECWYLDGCIRESRSFIACRNCARKEER